MSARDIRKTSPFDPDNPYNAPSSKVVDPRPLSTWGQAKRPLTLEEITKAESTMCLEPYDRAPGRWTGCTLEKGHDGGHHHASPGRTVSWPKDDRNFIERMADPLFR